MQDRPSVEFSLGDGTKFWAEVAGVQDAASSSTASAAMPKLPILQAFEFQVLAASERESARQPFEFRVVPEVQPANFLNQVFQRRSRVQGWELLEDLGNGLALEMVEIPGGNFWMGSPETEVGRSSHEGPQQTVAISALLLGRYPVTQAQWRAVANLPEVTRPLNPNPSYFQGSDRPVERVSWLEAVEFCDRLSRLTGRPYRLPTEAEWEYACRAGTTTPFHLGAALTPNWANYKRDNRSDRGETTPVGRYKIANAFGLSELHGNVWEWCADRWRDTLEPGMGGAVIEVDRQSETVLRVLRGGAWISPPQNCRSAARIKFAAAVRSYGFGFRVACSAERISP